VSFGLRGLLLLILLVHFGLHYEWGKIQRVGVFSHFCLRKIFAVDY